jgi:hypothetical protein
MSQTRPSAGDLTGKIKAEQQHDALQEQRDRAQEMSLASAIEDQEQREGVFDPHTQTRLDVPVAVVEETVFPGQPGGFHAPERNEEPVFTGYESEEQMTPFLATRNEPPAPRALVRSPMVKIRVTQDIEDMTYGMTANGYPNNMTFREGFTYEVNVNIAEHLNERGLVAQWVG